MLPRREREAVPAPRAARGPQAEHRAGQAQAVVQVQVAAERVAAVQQREELNGNRGWRSAWIDSEQWPPPYCLLSRIETRPAG